MTTPTATTTTPITVRVFRAKVNATKGWAVTWGQPRRTFRQTLWFPTQAQAELLAGGLRAGEDAEREAIKAWGRPVAMKRADMGRLGGPARAAALSPERRREIAKQAVDARWARVRAAKAAEAEQSIDAPEGSQG